MRDVAAFSKPYDSRFGALQSLKGRGFSRAEADEKESGFSR